MQPSQRQHHTSSLIKLPNVNIPSPGSEQPAQLPSSAAVTQNTPQRFYLLSKTGEKPSEPITFLLNSRVINAMSQSGSCCTRGVATV